MHSNKLETEEIKLDYVEVSKMKSNGLLVQLVLLELVQ